jgi:CRP/FNR family transcriptional regulator, cyclic AMP receptor protein
VRDQLRSLAVPFLDGLCAASVDALTSLGRGRKYPRGSLIFAEGDAAAEVLIITSGSVKVLVTSMNGREVVLEVMDEGDILGELSAIDAGERSATAIALTNVDVLAIAQAAFLERVTADADLSLRLLCVLADRVRGASRRQLEFGSNDALGRLCQRLMELVRRSGEHGHHGPITVTVPMSQQDLAAWAGLSREAIVKGIHTLRRLGWVEMTGRSVTIVDLDAISRRAQS